MDSKEFDQSFAAQMERCEHILLRKAKEYATDDRLHNFKVAAELQGITPRQALAGMMAKHTVSIYDMISSKGYIPKEKWQEKLTDHLNYLFILAAIVDDDFNNERF